MHWLGFDLSIQLLTTREPSRFYPFTYDDSLSIIYSVEEMLADVVKDCGLKSVHYGGTVLS
jgi:hypothetical protein